MNLLLIGSGGREHALAWALRHSPQVDTIYVAPGNGGTARMEGVQNVPLSAEAIPALRDFARAHAIGLTVVGPEGPLAAGIVDTFHAAGLPIFGPTQAAAQLESSKAFSKQFMQRHAIPTGHAALFTEHAPALAFLKSLEALPVIKASGLAAGKGVIVPATWAEAEEALRAMLIERRFGASGATVLIEERLAGPELSVLAFCDGRTARVLPAAQDHKRLLDQDQGPNTGGMGAYAPAPLLTPALLAAIEEQVLRPTLRGMADEGTPYVGVLYAGLMLTDGGPQVLEFNCRLGDPEAQAILPLLASDPVRILQACLQGQLDAVEIVWRASAAVTVVVAAGGYPEQYEGGRRIYGVGDAERAGCLVFQAGTRLDDGHLLTAGGRVLAVTGVAPSIAEATQQAYRGVEQVHFEGMHYRRDIAARALVR